MLKHFSSFIKDIQNSNERKKRFWLWIFSGTTIMVVVALWGVYMNSVIVSVYPAKNASPVVVTKPAENSVLANISTITSVFKTSIKTLGGELKVFSNKIRARFSEANLSRTFI